MAKLTQTISQVAPPTQPIAFARAGAFQQSDASAQVLGSLGKGVAGLGQIKKAMDEKYQSHMDDLRSYEAKDTVKLAQIDIEGIYENESDPAKWEGLVQSRIEKAKSDIAGMMIDVSPERRDFLESQLESFDNIENAKMQSLRLKTVSQKNLISGLSSFQQAIETEGPDSPTAELIFKGMESKHRDWFGSHDEFLLEMDKKKDAATAEFQNNQRDIAKTRVAGLIQSGVFTDTNGDIDTESVNSMVDQLVEDPTEKAEMMKFAKGVVSTVEIDKSAQKKRLVAAADTSLNESIKSITEGQTLDQAIKEIQALPDKFDPFKADMTKSATAFFSSFRSAMKPAPTVSKVESSISMEGALTDVRKGRIDRTQYINTYNANAEGLSETDRIKYGTSFQKEYDAMVDDSVSDNRGVLYNSVVTNTDENMLSLRDKVDRNELRDYIFNAQQMRHQTEKLLVEQADLEIANFLSTDRAKNISREQLLKELSIINATYESKDWITEYQKRKGESGEFQKLEKSISDEFNKRASAKSKKSMDWYSELPASQQRSIISIVSGGGTIDDAIRAAGRGEI